MSHSSRKYWFSLLLIPFLALLWTPFYNHLEPYGWGLPFFYWYQLAWVILSAAITALVYLKTRTDRESEQNPLERSEAQ